MGDAIYVFEFWGGVYKCVGDVIGNVDVCVSACVFRRVSYSHNTIRASAFQKKLLTTAHFP